MVLCVDCMYVCVCVCALCLWVFVSATVCVLITDAISSKSALSAYLPSPSQSSHSPSRTWIMTNYHYYHKVNRCLARYFCTFFPGDGQYMIRVKKWTIFWATYLSFWTKNLISAIRPQFLSTALFVALGEKLHIQPSERFFDFLFPSYSWFRKKTTDAPKSLPPPHCGGRGTVCQKQP